MYIKSIEDLVRGRDLHAIAPEAQISDACNALTARNAGALAVCRAGALLGLVSDREVVRHWHRIEAGEARIVADIMVPDPVTVDVGASLAEAQERIRRGRCRHLPVMRDGLPVAMLSFGDLPAEPGPLGPCCRDGPLVLQ